MTGPKPFYRPVELRPDVVRLELAKVVNGARVFYTVTDVLVDGTRVRTGAEASPEKAQDRMWQYPNATLVVVDDRTLATVEDPFCGSNVRPFTRGRSRVDGHADGSGGTVR